MPSTGGWPPGTRRGRCPGSASGTSCPGSPRRSARIAAEGRDGFYLGPVAEAIAAASWLAEADLAAHRSEWVEPLRLAYRGIEVCELPPNGQGAAALIALALSDGLDLGLHGEIEAMKLALADAHGHIADAPLPGFLLDPAHLAERRALIRADRALDAQPSREGATTYLCCVDGDRNAISLIQSTYDHFGSGVLPGTRASCCRTGARASAPSPATRTSSRPPSARSTRSSRGCCSRAGSCSARSA